MRLRPTHLLPLAAWVFAQSGPTPAPAAPPPSGPEVSAQIPQAASSTPGLTAAEREKLNQARAAIERSRLAGDLYQCMLKNSAHSGAAPRSTQPPRSTRDRRDLPALLLPLHSAGIGEFRSLQERGSPGLTSSEKAKLQNARVLESGGKQR